MIFKNTHGNVQRDLAAMIVLVIVATALLFPFAGSGSLLPSDDCIYTQAAREGARAGHVFDVTWQGRPLFEKGPVLFMALMASQAVFGDGEFGARLPSILAAIFVVLAVFRIGRSAGLSTGSAFIAATFLLATNMFYFNARRPMTDMIGMAFGLWGFYLSAFGRSRVTAALGGVSFGLALLTKIVAPAPFVMALLLLQAIRNHRRPQNVVIALLTAILVALPWHIFMGIVHGREFFSTYIGYHMLARATHKVVGEGPIAVYGSWISDREGIAIALAMAAFLTAVLPAFRRRRPMWIATGLLFGALVPVLSAKTALPHYLLPILPGLAIALGAGAEAIMGAAEARRGSWGKVLVLGVVGALFLAGFLRDNMVDLAFPDYGESSRSVCDRLKETGRLERLAGTFDLHDTAIPWYCDHQTVFYGAEPGWLSATINIPMLKGTVKPVDQADLAMLIEKDSILVTVEPRLTELAQMVSRAGGNTTPEKVGNLYLVSLKKR